ncbi:salutaridine reductase [Cocos nucifera]|uniref:Salutaridine reductase n=1 Tax=Cocos nucifera TaxID=13894 RepID=A0A8K0IFH9_COCNU|nr:salutaridine reductase [Cocos nucifera]
MEGAIGSSPVEKRIAVVTGGNKGIGLEVCRQLALNGVKVILTARDEKRGMAAVEKLRESGLSDVVFHQLDVTDSSSITSLARYIGARFGKLDILKVQDTDHGILNWMKENFQQTYEMAEECLKTNYHGVKDVTEALLPHLLSSHSGTIVNVSSTVGQLQVTNYSY